MKLIVDHTFNGSYQILSETVRRAYLILIFMQFFYVVVVKLCRKLFTEIFNTVIVVKLRITYTST